MAHEISSYLYFSKVFKKLFVIAFCCFGFLFHFYGFVMFVCLFAGEGFGAGD